MVSVAPLFLKEEATEQPRASVVEHLRGQVLTSLENRFPSVGVQINS
jgi:hypothetical protein